MRIAVLGAPKSGKTRFANALRKELADMVELSTIDNYVPALKRKTDLALGHYANYVQNIMVASDRLILEESAKDNFITCGTIFDTIGYTMLKGQDTIKNTPEGKLEIVRAEAAFGALGMLAADTFNYDYAFYLPLKAKKENNWDNMLSDLLPIIVQDHFLYITQLDGKLQENVEFAAKIIRRIENDKIEATKDQQPAVGEDR